MGELMPEDPLAIDEGAEIQRISSWLRAVLRDKLNRRGLVVALSGGVDSSVCAALAVAALGSNKVLGLMLPEQDSSPESLTLARDLANHLNIPYLIEDITASLAAVGCYRWRDEAIQAVFPEYTTDWRSKIVISGSLEGQINHFRLVVQPPGQEMQKAPLKLKEYLQIVAATNYKQRIRKIIEYFHADRLNYAVLGTPNRLEYDQGFFVKNGDGAADVKPIAHLYKTQVYKLAHYLGLPEQICQAQPTTDTYSLSQGQDEFYFALPYAQMDLALWAYNHNVPQAVLAQLLNIEEQKAHIIYKDIESKRRTTQYQHLSALVIDQIFPNSSTTIA
jgi:NAD+ synthase